MRRNTIPRIPWIRPRRAWYSAICDSIKEAAKIHIPLRGDFKPTQRSVSERTKALIAKRISLVSRNASKSAIRKIRKQIKRSSLQDYKDWVAKTVSDMESANKVGDTKKIFRLVNLSPANRKPLQKHSLKMTKATY